ncbi:MAG: D-amino-acid oxidase [Phenylobacterium zucineum]|nr:MAG: D-amino-acid oxidase [Phenylobacterium zucineum]
MDRAKLRVKVAGGGAFGLTIAWSLAEAGFQVSLHDPGRINASSVAAGMLAPVFETVLDPQGAHDLNMLMMARDLWPALADRVGIMLDQTGALAVGHPEFLERVSFGLGRLNVAAQGVNRFRLETAVPGLGGIFRDGVLTDEDWRLAPVSALTALRAAAAAAGVAFQTQSVAGLDGCDRLVIATGAGQDLMSLAPLLKGLTPIKGQILRSAGRVFEGVLRLPTGYCVGGSGDLAIGATMEPGLSDLVPTVEARARLEAWGVRPFQPSIRGSRPRSG